MPDKPLSERLYDVLTGLFKTLGLTVADPAAMDNVHRMCDVLEQTIIDATSKEYQITQIIAEAVDPVLEALAAHPTCIPSKYSLGWKKPVVGVIANKI